MRPSILTRLEKLENECRFVNWFLGTRFIESLAETELLTYARDGTLPDPVPNRPSDLDGLDRKSLLRKYEEHLRIYEYRTSEDNRRFCDRGRWPEQQGRLHYSNANGGLHVEFRIEPEEEGVVGITTQEPER
jgi:hypothetical protein